MPVENGFLLTRQARDVGNSTLIELWVKTDHGPQRLLIQNERPVMFVAQSSIESLTQWLNSQSISAEVKPLGLHTFKQVAVAAIYTQTIRDNRRIFDYLQSIQEPVWEQDVRLSDRYLMERFIQGGIEFHGTINQKHGYFEVAETQCRKGSYHPTLTRVSLDIECSEKGILYSIGLDSELDSRVLMIGQPQHSDTPIQWVDNEKQLLQELVVWFNRYDPDIIVGWSVIDFDLRLLNKRAEFHCVPLNLGRGNQKAHYRALPNMKSFISIPGRVVLDGIDTLKTATYHFRSWSLESVSRELLGEGKAINNVHDRMDEINQMYRHDKPALAKYNLQDCVLVNRIFDHTNLIEFAIERSNLTGVELDRVGGSVAAFTNLYLPRLHRAGYVAPNLEPENWLASPGGYVMDSIPGLYDSVLVLDFKSLYPAIIRTFLIDPLGLVEGLKQTLGLQENQSVAGFKGAQFHRTKHFLPDLIQTLWSARDEAKKLKRSAFSQAIKIIMNSFYGVLGSSGCRFFDTRLASSITMRGHEIMKQTKALIEAKGYQVIYGDTDSTFVSLNGKYDTADADKIGKDLVRHINDWWKHHIKQEHGLDSCLELEYETHYRRFLMPTIRGSETGSKKRYAGLIQSEQGDSELVFKGLESARTDWTPLSQEFQRTLYKMVFNGDDPTAYVQEMVNRTQAGEFDQQLIYRKRLRRKLSEYQKNIPPQVKAAKLADQMNEQLGRPLQYQNKGYIEYCITTNGPEPWEYRQSPIDYQHYIDKQLAPVADGILPFIGMRFEDLTAPQLGLF